MTALSDRARSLAGLYVAVPVLVATVLVQATIIPRLRLLGVSGNLVLVAVVAWTLLRGFDEAVLLAFVGGLGIDLIAGLPPGVSSLALAGICYLSSLGETSLFQGNFFLPLIAAALATPLYAGVLLLVQQLRGLQVDWLGTATHIVLPEIALNVAAAAVVFPVLKWITARILAERLQW